MKVISTTKVEVEVKEEEFFNKQIKENNYEKLSTTIIVENIDFKNIFWESYFQKTKNNLHKLNKLLEQDKLEVKNFSVISYKDKISSEEKVEIWLGGFDEPQSLDLCVKKEKEFVELHNILRDMAMDFQEVIDKTNSGIKLFQIYAFEYSFGDVPIFYGIQNDFRTIH